MKFNFEEEHKKEQRKKILLLALRWIVEIAIVVGIGYLVAHFCLLKTTMVDGAMDNSIKNNQDVVVNKSSYLVFSPKRNDIIAFTRTNDVNLIDEPLIMIRRVIGLPGEKVQIKDGSIFINDVKLDEKYMMTAMNSGGLAEAPITLGEDEYFVLGDNRNDSEDSRYRSFGNVKEENIYGKVILKLNSLGLIGGPVKEKEEDS